MGSTTVLVIGDRPIEQLDVFREPHELNGGGSWLYCICTIDSFVLKPDAVGHILESSKHSLAGDFIEVRGGRVGRARKDAIDFEAMRDAAGARAAKTWAHGASVRGGMSWESWHEIHSRYPPGPARQRYDEQPAVRAMRDAGIATEGSVADWLRMPLSEYVQLARDSAIVEPYFQVVHVGELLVDNSEDAHERDRSEPLQPIADYKHRLDVWHARFNAILDESPGHTLLTSALVKV